MEFLTKLRLSYAVGGLALWNVILGAGLFFVHKTYFGFAVAFALLAFGSTSFALSFGSAQMLSQMYRIANTAPGDLLDRIRGGLRSYGGAFVMAGFLALTVSVISITAPV